jgi:hypothetical protein
MNFILAENLDEVFAVAFDRNAKAKKGVNKAGKKPKVASTDRSGAA